MSDTSSYPTQNPTPPQRDPTLMAGPAVAANPTQITIVHDVTKALELNIPPFNWVPPEKPPLQPTTKQPIDLANMNGLCDELENLKDDLEIIAGPKKHFHHAHPNGDHDGSFGKAVKELRRKFSKKEYIPGGTQADDYVRLQLAFEWIVCKTISLSGAINDAVKDYNKRPHIFTKAKEDYINFIKHLTDHNQNDCADLDTACGYGEHFSWFFIIPVIYATDEFPDPLIQGMIIIGEWTNGYHISSSGVAIP